MNCPTCKRLLRPYRYRGLVVDLCPECGGIWFDAGEMMDYIRFMLHDDSDVPYAKVELKKPVLGEDLIGEPPRSCPRCDQHMQKRNFAYDSNILLDRCTTCGGLWTDAGEICKLAIFIKGNPTLDALGRSVVQEKRHLESLQGLAGLGKTLSQPAAFKIFLPKIILPLGRDISAYGFPGIVLIIIVANIAAYFYQIFGVTDASSFYRTYGLIPSVVLSGKGYLSFITSMFLHVGFWHLVGNMFFFWIFAPSVEDALGHVLFLFFYFVCGIAASAADILTYRQSSIPVIGASGAIAGIMGAYLALYPRTMIKTLFITNVIDVPAYLYLGVWIAFQFLWEIVYTSIGDYSSAAWSAHAGGFVAGFVLAAIGRKRRFARFRDIREVKRP